VGREEVGAAEAGGVALEVAALPGGLAVSDLLAYQREKVPAQSTTSLRVSKPRIDTMLAPASTWSRIAAATVS
jgi:hypothetical protein